ncbi:MAG: IS3 family transposase [Subdoligranulum sp.]
MTTIYHENRGRYGYRRITAELRKRNFLLNHKTVQRLMKELEPGLPCQDEEVPLL